VHLQVAVLDLDADGREAAFAGGDFDGVLFSREIDLALAQDFSAGVVVGPHGHDQHRRQHRQREHKSAKCLLQCLPDSL
jgi:hypothetical protein